MGCTENLCTPSTMIVSTNNFALQKVASIDWIVENIWIAQTTFKTLRSLVVDDGKENESVSFVEIDEEISSRGVSLYHIHRFCTQLQALQTQVLQKNIKKIVL